jgi:hypothetical protein
MVRVLARHSDRMRAKPIIAFIVSDPKDQGGNTRLLLVLDSWVRLRSMIAASS